MWVRSQDRKTLCNAEIISIFKGTNDYQFYGDGSHFEDTILGTYSTEQRTIEVLDEIQTTLIKVLKDADNRHEIVWVYEMPKE